jgi:hypothetical protein
MTDQSWGANLNRELDRMYLPTAFDRAAVKALGYDPDTCRLEVVRGPFAGVRVVDGRGMPQRFVRLRDLAKMEIAREV